ncbi:choline transporter-like protein 5 isoform X1 [Corythoichthys intestinalis]|uniref:choline transporter-like protein 5 isoform X1 n=1 Tax=Corythoichthys intestinalis TaxID=161448 RepID=UPI0025A5131B|nr:choline transporter-like protein 5 isoform X1 [Corythoichthys intestinalis]
MARKSDIPSIYYGEPHKFDPKFRGPIHNRSRTDVVCCVVFFIFIFGYMLLGFIAWFSSDPKKIAYPTDSYGKICGEKENMNKTFLYYMNMLKCVSIETVFNFECPTVRLCVEKCPVKYEKLSEAKKDPEKWKIYKQYCKPETDENNPYTTLIAKDDCPANLFPSRPFLKRCTLAVNANNTELLKNQTRNGTTVSENFTSNFVEDLALSWKWILLCLIFALLVSLFFILMLRFIAGVLVWVFIIAALGSIGYGIIYCTLKYKNLSETEGGDITISQIGFQTDANVYLDLSETWLIFLSVLSVIEGILLIVLIFLRERLAIAIVLLKESSRAIGYVMSALIFPIFTFLLLSISIAYGAVVAICLSTTGVPIYKILPKDGCVLENDACDPKTFNESTMTGKCSGSKCFFSHYGGENFFQRYTLVFQLCNVFMLLWLVNFIIALGQCTMAGAFASYYWALRKPKDIPPCPIVSSFNRAIYYHTGSLALGALILSVVQMIRLVLEYLDKKLKGSQTAFARFMMSCLKYCFWCLERFLKFLNRNAYIMIAIYGKSFCTSSKDAFFLLLRNVIRVAVLDKVTEFVLFLGKLLVTGSISALAYFFFSNQIPLGKIKVPVLYTYWVPVVVVALGSFVISSGFFSVYSMCVDTLFLCFCEDLERNDGSASRPYYMSPELRKILHKENEVEMYESVYESVYESKQESMYESESESKSKQTDQ